MFYVQALVRGYHLLRCFELVAQMLIVSSHMEVSLFIANLMTQRVHSFFFFVEFPSHNVDYNNNNQQYCIDYYN